MGNLPIPSTIDLSDFYAAAGTILVALFSMWIVKRVKGLVSR